jgi:xanthine dehydrogenase YagT iron-sulfur-binding subunit
VSLKDKTEGQEETQQPRDGFSRRTFMQGVGTGAVGAGILAPNASAEPATGTGTTPVGPGKVPIELVVNGRRHKTEVEPRVTLLDALRNHLDYTGAKKVCDRATCGACTMIVNGHPVYSCTMLALEAQGSNIQTVEGLASDERLHAVQQYFVENDAQQCGFCTPGFVVACKSFLDSNPDPTMEEVEKGLSGNICRCGTYVGVRHAVLDAARAMKGGRSGD